MDRRAWKEFKEELLEIEVQDAFACLTGLAGLAIIGWIFWDLLSEHGLVGTLIIVGLFALLCAAPVGVIVLGIALVLLLGAFLGPIGWVIAVVALLALLRR